MLKIFIMRLFTFSFLKSLKYKTICIRNVQRMASSRVSQPNLETRKLTGDPELVQISPSWREDEEPELRAAVARDMQVFPEFISQHEEAALLAELEPRLRKMRYEFDHWDDAIQGFRETERSVWTPENEAVFARVRELAFGGGAGSDGAVSGGAGSGGALVPLPHVHVLDLAPTGHIKPHVDAVRFCGDVIAGVCLLSSAVMRLQHCERAHLALDALLAQRCLYIMRGRARYEFSHAVLGGAPSAWRGAPLPRARRLALICRTRPHPHNTA